MTTVPIEPFLIDFAKQTEKIIGSIIIKKGVKISDTSQKNIVVQVLKTATGFNVEYLYRNSLRFADMGVGRGWDHGVKISAQSYSAVLGKFKSRKRKNITNRPAFASIHRLEEALAVEIEDIAVKTLLDGFQDMNLDPRIKNGLLVRMMQRSGQDRNSSADRKKFNKLKF